MCSGGWYETGSYPDSKIRFFYHLFDIIFSMISFDKYFFSSSFWLKKCFRNDYKMTVGREFVINKILRK